MVEICPVGCQDEACTYLIIAPSSRVDASVIGILMFMYACGARIDMRLPRLSSRAMNSDSEALYGLVRQVRMGRVTRSCYCQVSDIVSGKARRR